MNTRMDILVAFTNGVVVEVGDHKWSPIDRGGIVAYSYRGRAPVEMDAVDATIAAWPIIERHARYATMSAFA